MKSEMEVFFFISHLDLVSSSLIFNEGVMCDFLLYRAGQAFTYRLLSIYIFSCLACPLYMRLLQRKTQVDF